MNRFYSQPNDPANPYGGTDIDNDLISDLEDEAGEEKYEAEKSENICIND